MVRLQLDSMIFKVFSNLSNPLILNNTDNSSVTHKKKKKKKSVFRI